MRRFATALTPLRRVFGASQPCSTRFSINSGARAFSTPPANDGVTIEGVAIEEEEGSVILGNEESSIEMNEDGDVEVIEPIFDEFDRAYGTGRRKTGVARVWIKEGSGQFIINNKTLHEYFQPQQRRDCAEAFHHAGQAGMFDVWCTVKGGGVTGQAGAIRLGTARALTAIKPHLRPTLSKAGYLSRDPRRVERKKPGQAKARKKFQWVKR